MSGFVTPTVPNPADYLTFLRTQVNIGRLYLPDDSLWISISYDIAVAMVMLELQAISPAMYTIAVYNLAADRLFNIATDAEGQSYFDSQRRKYGIGGGFMPGVVSGTSDQGTSTSILNPEQFSLLTVQDLETLKTPWGRRYMAWAQAYGRSIWGIS